MNRIMTCLRSRRGESLVEALASILVFTLSSILLFTMINTANSINQTTKEKEAERQSQLSAAEGAPDTTKAYSLDITYEFIPETQIKEGVTKRDTVSVNLSRKADQSDAMFAFSRVVPGGDTE